VDLLDTLGSTVKMVEMELQAILVLKDTLVNLVDLVHLVYPVRMEFLDRWDLLDQLD